MAFGPARHCVATVSSVLHPGPAAARRCCIGAATALRWRLSACLLFLALDPWHHLLPRLRCLLYPGPEAHRRRCASAASTPRRPLCARPDAGTAPRASAKRLAGRAPGPVRSGRARPVGPRVAASAPHRRCVGASKLLCVTPLLCVACVSRLFLRLAGSLSPAAAGLVALVPVSRRLRGHDDHSRRPLAYCGCRGFPRGRGWARRQESAARCRACALMPAMCACPLHLRTRRLLRSGEVFPRVAGDQTLWPFPPDATLECAVVHSRAFAPGRGLSFDTSLAGGAAQGRSDQLVPFCWVALVRPSWGDCRLRSGRGLLAALSADRSNNNNNNI